MSSPRVCVWRAHGSGLAAVSALFAMAWRTAPLLVVTEDAIARAAPHADRRFAGPRRPTPAASAPPEPDRLLDVRVVQTDDGRFCVRMLYTHGSGGGCTFASSPDVMMSFGSNGRDAPAVVTALDPLRRLAALRVTTGDVVEDTAARDGGPWAWSAPAAVADLVEAVDGDGHVLAAVHPSKPSPTPTPPPRPL